MLTDSHVHFQGTMTPADIAGVVDRAVSAGVGRLIAVGCEPETNTAALRAASLIPERVKAAVAYDRSLAGSGVTADGIRSLIQKAPAGHVVAVGEIGLDYHYSPETSRPQQDLFSAQLELARDLRLPVIIHNRDADCDMLALLTAHARGWGGAPDQIGVLHCFTGNESMARSLLDLGYMISFSGIVTFRNADALRAVAAIIPSDRLLMETDTPYLAPVPHRGQPNEPAFLPAVASLLATVRGEPIDSLARITSANAAALFGWPLSE